MSNNGKHLSASERKIAALTQHCMHLEQMRDEFFLLLNYLIKMNGGVYRLFKADLQILGPPQIVRSERKHHEREHPEDASGECIEFTLCDPEPEKSRIITPS